VTASTAAATTHSSTASMCSPRGLRRQVRTTRGVLRPRARRDRHYARVAARLALSSGKSRGPYARANIGQRPLQKGSAQVLLIPFPPLPKRISPHLSGLCTC
jgi:hypothetical protein